MYGDLRKLFQKTQTNKNILLDLIVLSNNCFCLKQFKMNRKDELNEENEIDSYELNDDDFSKNLNQYARNSTLLMDRYGNESPDEMVK